jgi:DNA replication protein DnaC
LAAYRGFAKDVRPFVENFGERIIIEPNLEKWTTAVLKYKTFTNANLTFKNVEVKLKNLLGLMKIEPVTASELDFYLAKSYGHTVIEQFWKERIAIDKESWLQESNNQKEEIIRAIREPKKQNQLSTATILQDFKIASAPVSELSNEFDNMEGSHIERTETQQILTWINSDLSDKEKNNSLLLVGGAGVGKSVIMKDLVCYLMDTEISVIAIKSDKYAPMTIKDLEAQLNLKDSLDHEIQSLLMNGSDKVVVLIDQIDALSQTQSNRREPINTFRTLISTLLTIPKVRIIISVRAFDLQEDADLIDISRKAEKVKVGDLSIEQIEKVLQKKSLNIQNLSEPLKQLLKNASNLDLFCRILNDTLDLNRLATRQDLQQELFKQRIINNKISSANCITLVYEIAEKMYAQERIIVAAEPFLIKYKNELKYLVSEGILTLKKDYIQFFHQTFYDFTFAKSFVHKGNSILEYIQENHQGLKIRAVVKMLFDFTRGDNPKEYLRLLNEVLFSDEFSFHIKHLLITNICFLTELSPKEKTFVRDKILTSPTFKKVFLESVSSPDWLSFLIDEDIFNDLLNPDVRLYDTDKNREIFLCRLILCRFLSNNTDIILEYIANELSDFEGKARVVTEVLMDLKTWTNPIATELFEKYFKRHEDDNHWYCHVLENAVNDQPDWVLTQIKFKKLSKEGFRQAGIELEYSEGKLLALLFEKAFAKTLVFAINLIKQIAEETKYNLIRDSDDEESMLMGDYGISDTITDSVEGDEHHETFYGIVMNNIKKMAKEDSEAFREFFYANLDNPFIIIQRFLVKSLIENSEQYPKECFECINNFGKNKGFELSVDYSYYVRELINMSYSNFSEKEQNQIDDFILSTKDTFYLKCYQDGDTKRHYLQGYGRKKLIHLLSIPIEEVLRKPKLKKEYQELRRKHSDIENEAPQKSVFSAVPAPYSPKVYDKMTLEQWEQTFLEIDSDEHFFDSKRGSLLEHYRKFTAEVKLRADFFLPLITKLVKDWRVKEEYILAGIEGLVEAEYEAEVVCNIVNQVIKKLSNDSSKVRQLHRIINYLIHQKAIDDNIISFLCRNVLENKDESLNDYKGQRIIDKSINSITGSAIWYIMDCYDLPKFHSKIFETLEQIANDSISIFKIPIMLKLKYWLKVDKEKVFEIFIKLTNEVHPELFKYAVDVVQYLNRTHFEGLQDFYQNALLYPDELPQIAKALCYNWINGNEKAYPIFISMANDKSKVKAELINASVKVLKDCEPKYWDKSVQIFEMFMVENSKDVVDAYERSFLFLPKQKFDLLLPSIKKYAVSSTKKHVSRYYYEYILAGVKKHPIDCLELIEHFDKYQEPDIREGNYYDKEVIQVLLSAYNVLFDEDAEKNHLYLLKAISIFDRILQNDRFRSTSDMVLKEVEN